jgi:hypothetical protein
MMQNVYFGCAAVGGTILVLQTLLTLFTGGHDVDGAHDVHDLHDVSHDGDAHATGHGDAFIKLFTFKTLVAFITFFGLAGLAGEWNHTSPATTLTLALLAGGAALFAVAWMMHLLALLQSKGNVRLENAVGGTAQVYLRIPAREEGPGKVTLSMQGRTVELKAVTTGPEIPTGTLVKVVALRPGETLEVLPVALAAAAATPLPTANDAH